MRLILAVSNLYLAACATDAVLENLVCLCRNAILFEAQRDFFLAWLCKCDSRDGRGALLGVINVLGTAARGPHTRRGRRLSVQIVLRRPLHSYSITRDPKAIFRLTRAPGTAIRSPAGTCIVRLSM